MIQNSFILRELKRDIARGRIVVLVGTGISAASSGNHAYTNWRGLLRSGVDKCLTFGAASPAPNWKACQHSALDEGDLIDMLGVAQQVESRLRAAGGEFARWLKETIGSIRLTNPSVLNAIAKINAPIATTNYDLFIESALSRSSILWADDIDVIDWLSSPTELSAVLHLHGTWNRPTTVILGHTSYQALLDHGYAQFIQRVIASTRSFLFIGCGEGLEDPNLGALIEWIKSEGPHTYRRHYRLCTDQERDRLLKSRNSNDRVYPLSYGASHSELLGFLKGLAHYKHLIPSTLADKADEYRACIPQMIEGEERPKRKDALVREMADIVNQQRIPFDALEDSLDEAFAAALAWAIGDNPNTDDIPRLLALADRENLQLNAKYKIIDAFGEFAKKRVALSQDEHSASIQCLKKLVATTPCEIDGYDHFSGWAQMAVELLEGPR